MSFIIGPKLTSSILNVLTEDGETYEVPVEAGEYIEVQGDDEFGSVLFIKVRRDGKLAARTALLSPVLFWIDRPEDGPEDPPLADWEKGLLGINNNEVNA